MEISHASTWAASLSHFCVYVEIHILLKEILVTYQYKIN